MVRQINEDAFLELPGAGLWVVADGMGDTRRGLCQQPDRRHPAPRSTSDALAIYTTALRTRLAEVNAAVREETPTVAWP